MNLLVDLGNSRIKWARSAPGVWTTAADLLPADAIAGVLDRLWGDMQTPEKVVLSSVANPKRLGDLQQWLERHWSLHAHVVEPVKELLGVRNHYHDPASLGTDRWVALIAARRLVAGPVCVVDCGTAVTMDTLSADGNFLGGVIFPGLRVLRASLVNATDGIRETSGDDVSCFGRSTADAVAAGSLFGLAGAIERVLTEYKDRLGDDMEVLFTGADAAAVIPKVRLTAREIPDLVLKGLAFIAEDAA